MNFGVISNMLALSICSELNISQVPANLLCMYIFISLFASMPRIYVIVQQVYYEFYNEHVYSL